jgi:hypothetical protein
MTDGLRLRGTHCQRDGSVGRRVDVAGSGGRSGWCRVLVGVLILMSSACAKNPDQADLVAKLLEEYRDHYREYLHWADGPMRIDASVTVSDSSDLVRPASVDLEKVVRDAVERAGVPTGDWEQARQCAAFNASLGVPEVIAEVVAGRKRAPEGCVPGTGAVFLVGLDLTADSLRMFGLGNGREGHFSFTGVISRDGSGAQIVETKSMWTR